jgi:hypothetical protein
MAKAEDEANLDELREVRDASAIRAYSDLYSLWPTRGPIVYHLYGRWFSYCVLPPPKRLEARLVESWI